MSAHTPDPLYNPWRVSLENCITGDNYLRAQEYQDLIDEIDMRIREAVELRKDVASWRGYAAEYASRGAEWGGRLMESKKVVASCIAALRELVAVKDASASAAVIRQYAAKHPNDENYATVDEMDRDLAKRRDAAWDAARSILAEAKFDAS